jgi:chemotaxis methyl-accepting protein methylase
MKTPARGLEAILAHLARVRQVELGDYRREPLERGIAGRVAATGAGDAARYGALLEREPAEVDRLLEALIVQVTGFFRDPPVFEALGGAVLPVLHAGLAPGTPLRAWVVGAASGEEAYSAAMLLDDATAGGARRPFEVLGTDIVESALARARDGRYSLEAAACVPPALAARHLAFDGGAVRIVEALRSRVRFARHDVLGLAPVPREAVIASFDLVFFRNVLLYLDERARAIALGRVAAALRPGGALVLGLSERPPGRAAAALEPFPGTDPSLRIFRQRGSP